MTKFLLNKYMRNIKKITKIKLIFSIISLIISLLFIFFIFKLNVLPNKYICLLTMVLLGTNICGMILLVLKGTIKNVIGLLLHIIILIISIIGIKYSGSIINYLNEGFSNANVEYVSYSVMVLKDSNYKKLSDLTNTDMGYLLIELDSDKYLDKIKKEVNINLKQKNMFKLYDDLINKKIQSIIINDSYLELLEEKIGNFDDNTKTIYHFSIKIEKENNNIKLSELKPVNIYISGSDSRSGNIPSRNGSDVNIILTLNPNTHTILLTNIPRDYYVTLHGTNNIKDRLTYSGMYGIDMSKNTIEDLMNIKIDYTIKFGFKSVIELVDLIGGIDIYSDKSFVTHCTDGGAKKVKIVAGMNHLNGAQTLSFVRERYAYNDGDRQRGKNQQKVIEKIFNKIISDKTFLTNCDSLLNLLSNLYRTDIPKEFITLLIKQQIDNMSEWKMIHQSVDGTGTLSQSYSMPGYDDIYVMIPNAETIKIATAKINEVLNK